MRLLHLNSYLLSLLLATSLLQASDHQDTTAKGDDAVQSQHWSYAGSSGPSHWGDLDASYHDCKAGKRQSPIDFQTKSPAHGISDAGIYVDYHAVELDIINNGHTIQVDIADGNEAIINGKKYALLQFHFHAPSEHTIDGKPVEMEAHLVHRADDGELAVLGVMMRLGKWNNIIHRLWKHMPPDANGRNKMEKVTVNANDLLPKSKEHYHYLGSLTTPPCTQIVEWYVFKEPIEIDASQLKRFHELYDANARPVQRLNKRPILER